MSSPPVDFTIVTASRNYGRFIGDCLESVASQEGVTVQHLVIDACSTDETAEVVGRFPDVELIQEPDQGMSDGINKGFRLAKGKWVMWLNADDRLIPGALRAVLEFASKCPDSDVIYGGWNFVSEDGKKIRQMTVMPFQKATLVYLGCYLGSTATFLRRETTIEKGFFLNPAFKYVMDGEFYCHLASAGKKFSYLHAILAEFRIHGGNLSLVNHAESKGIDQALETEYQFSESRAIKRCYGARLTGKIMIDAVIHSLLFYFFLIRKGFSKRIYHLFHPLLDIQSSSRSQ